MRWAYVIVQAVSLMGLLAIDAMSRRFTDDNAAAREFILSDAFWPILFGGIAAAFFAMALLLLLSTFLPSRSGRQAAEGGE